ncbi:sugar-transfer associated ATP-grasp domain-containing protein [Flagellimonas sp.]|uniref:sugar-transfer associated ATP-grasp domain-containing protein n=1 Tax=Flagellimonas sp. TaxID=2058762 RepID=UPI003B52BBFB
MLGRFFNIGPNSEVVGLNDRNLNLIYPNNPRKHYALADDKVKSKEILHKNHIACAETYAVINRVSEIKRIWTSCKKYDTLAIKPANGCGGNGIKILRKRLHNNWISGGKIIHDQQVVHHIMSIISGVYSMGSTDSCLIEECIVPHPFFGEIYGTGVPDFRIITLKHKPVLAMLRMPTSKSDGKANLHQKGVGIGIDINKGTLTQVFDGKRYLDHHPDNPQTITGKPIPYWNELIEISKATAKAFPLDYLGIDLVIDKTKGPQVMEVNVRPGLGIQLVNKMGLRKAIALVEEQQSKYVPIRKLSQYKESPILKPIGEQLVG